MERFFENVAVESIVDDSDEVDFGEEFAYGGSVTERYRPFDHDEMRESVCSYRFRYRDRGRFDSIVDSLLVAVPELSNLVDPICHSRGGRPKCKL